MAQVTIELRNVLTLDDFELFDFAYKCDNPAWKIELEEKIVDEFYFNEIGQESIDRFKHVFRSTLQRIMPYYNDLYNTTLLGGDPFLNYKLSEVFDGDQINATDIITTANTTTGTDDTTTANTTTNSDGTTGLTQIEGRTQVNTKTDHPQTGDPILDIPSEKQDIKDDVTNTQDGTNTQDVVVVHSGTNKQDGTVVQGGTNRQDGTVANNYIKTIEGFTGVTYPDLLKQHRSNIIRVTSMVIKELKECFILVY